MASAPTPTSPAGPHEQHSWVSPERDVRALYQKHFRDRRKERQLLSTGSFFATFAAVRGITHAIRAERGPFKNITPGGRHIHHMTFGITGLLASATCGCSRSASTSARQASRLTSLAYGSGAALTLDEFALWLNLEDDYWTKQGRESIDAVALFGSLLALSVLGKGFFEELLFGRKRERRQPRSARRARQRRWARSTGGRSRTWSRLRSRSHAVGDTSIDRADRDRDLLLAPQVALLQQHMGDVVIVGVDHESLDLVRCLRRWRARVRRGARATSPTGTRSKMTTAGRPPCPCPDADAADALPSP